MMEKVADVFLAFIVSGRYQQRVSIETALGNANASRMMLAVTLTYGLGVVAAVRMTGRNRVAPARMSASSRERPSRLRSSRT